MKTKVWCALMMISVVSAWVFAAPDEKETSAEALEKAHQALQEAIATIRTYHLGDSEKLLQELKAPDGETLLALRRPKMGILVESSDGSGGQPAGALVVAVTPGGPADEAGLEAGDVITRVDGVPLDGKDGRPQDALIRMLVLKDEGDSVTVDYVRSGEAHSATVVLEGLDVDSLILHGPAVWLSREGMKLPVTPDAPEMAWFFPAGWLDMELVSLNPELGEYFGTDEGVLVVRGPSSGELGLRGGDVIVSIDERPIKSPTHAMRILRSCDPEERLSIEIMRHGRRETIEGSVPEQRVPLLEHWTEDR